MLVQSVVGPTVDNLQRQTDLELVCEGAPAYLLMLDSLLAEDPADRALLAIAVQAYIANAAIMEECGRPERSRAMADKARRYGEALLATIAKDLLPGSAPAAFDQAVARVGESEAAPLFWGAYGLATWVQYQSGAPLALAYLPRVEQLMTRVATLDATIFHGAAHTFLGAYYGARPPALGGDPVRSKDHFERSLTLGGRAFLLTQVAYAETYARQIFDRELFERLLREVVAYPMEQRPDIALSNQLAKRKAKRLLQQAEQLF